MAIAGTGVVITLGVAVAAAILRRRVRPARNTQPARTAREPLLWRS